MKRRSLSIMISHDLYDRLLSVLETSTDMSKRDFIENALEDAVVKLEIGEE